MEPRRGGARLHGEVGGDEHDAGLAPRVLRLVPRDVPLLVALLLLLLLLALLLAFLLLGGPRGGLRLLPGESTCEAVGTNASEAPLACRGPEQ